MCYYSDMKKMCKDCGLRELRYNNRSGFCSDCYGRNRPRAKKGTAEYKSNQQAQKENYEKNIVRERARARTWRFGLSIEQFDAIRINQDYRCRICRQHEDETGTLHVDHDHSCCETSRGMKTCGKCIRGLLCRDCNHGLGNFKDDIKKLQAAIDYINNYTPVSEQQVIDYIRIAGDIT